MAKMKGGLKIVGPDTSKNTMNQIQVKGSPVFGKGDKKSLIKGPDLSGGGHVK